MLNRFEFRTPASPLARRRRLLAGVAAIAAASGQAVACGGSSGSNQAADGGGDTITNDGSVSANDGAPHDAGGPDSSADASSADASSADASSADASSADASSADAAPTQCAQLTIPISNSDRSNTDFIIPLSGTIDFTNAVITARVYAPGAQGGTIQAYIQQGSPSYTQTFFKAVNIDTLSSWTTLSWPVMGSPTSGIQRLGLSVQSGLSGDASGTFEQPDSIIYVDKIAVTSSIPGIGPFVFNTAASVGAPTPSYPVGQLWLNTDDQPVPGSSALWDSVCGTPVIVDASAGIDGSTDATIADAAADATSNTPDATIDGSTDATTTDAAADAASNASDATLDGSTDASNADASSETSDAVAATCPPGLGDAGTGGCAALTVKLAGAGNIAHYDFDLPAGWDGGAGTDMTGSTVTAQVIAPNATGGWMQMYLQNATTYSWDATSGARNLAGLTSWSTIQWTVTSTSGVTNEGRLGIDVETGSDTAFEQPATVIFLNNVTVTLPNPPTSPVGPYIFPTASTLSLCDSEDGGACALQYTSNLWLNVGMYDTNVAASLGWLPN